jgi:membrane protein implicated in regulation of membrane protease activity
MSGSPRMLLWITFGSALVLGAILILATGEWWTLIIPLAIHGLASFLVLSGVFSALNERDKPDPVTQAHMDDSGKPPATP